MSDEVTMTVSEAVTTLKCLREILMANYYLTDNVRRYDERIATRLVMADAVAKYLFTLDLFLTDSVESRNIGHDSTKAFKMMRGGEWVVLLSDSESLFVLKQPSASDPQTVKASFPDSPKNAKAYHRWKLIDIPASQPTEFGPPDSVGRETRP